MRLRERQRDVITDMPVSAHRRIMLSGNVYDISTVMHLCHETRPKDPMTQAPLSVSDHERLRTRCAQLGVTPKRRAVQFDNTEDATEFHVDALLDTIQGDMLWSGSVSGDNLDRLAALLRSLQGRDRQQGQYLIDIIMRQLASATSSHTGETIHLEGDQPHPILAYLQRRL